MSFARFARSFVQSKRSSIFQNGSKQYTDFLPASYQLSLNVSSARSELDLSKLWYILID